jgi:tetraacyldisaccharide 4'-kinase
MHPFEFLYYLGSSARKYYSLKYRRQLPRRVISIGNITTGGTGKTPATIALAEEAKRRFLFPVILTRGYRGKAKGPCFVSKGEGPLLSVEEAGDEPRLMAERLMGVPIVKGADRYEAGLFALKELEAESWKHEPLVFILDDGFQHWRLQRDKDIVLVDALNPFGNGSLLPFGRLREPLHSLERADIVVLSKSTDGGQEGQGRMPADPVEREIRKYNATAPVFRAEHIPLGCRLPTRGKKPLEWLCGKKVFGFCALGDPLSFRKTVLSLGAQLLGCRTFRDHHRYSPSDIAKILKEAHQCGAEWIVTTEKDIIKLSDLDLPDNILTIEIAFSVEKGFYEEALRE